MSQAPGSGGMARATQWKQLVGLISGSEEELQFALQSDGRDEAVAAIAAAWEDDLAPRRQYFNEVSTLMAEFDLEPGTRALVEADIAEYVADKRAVKADTAFMAHWRSLLRLIILSNPNQTYLSGVHATTAVFLHVFMEGASEVAAAGPRCPLRTVHDAEYVEHDCFYAVSRMFEALDPYYPDPEANNETGTGVGGLADAIASTRPAISKQFLQLNFDVDACSSAWLYTLFATLIGMEFAKHLWDELLGEILVRSALSGRNPHTPFIVHVAAAILLRCEPPLSRAAEAGVVDDVIRGAMRDAHAAEAEAVIQQGHCLADPFYISTIARNVKVFKFDELRVGAELVETPNGLRVDRVSGPAASSRVGVGDTLYAINGVPATSLTLEQTVGLIKVVGRPLHLAFQRTSVVAAAPGGQKQRRLLPSFGRAAAHKAQFTNSTQAPAAQNGRAAPAPLANAAGSGTKRRPPGPPPRGAPSENASSQRSVPIPGVDGGAMSRHSSPPAPQTNKSPQPALPPPPGQQQQQQRQSQQQGAASMAAAAAAAAGQRKRTPGPPPRSESGSPPRGQGGAVGSAAMGPNAALANALAGEVASRVAASSGGPRRSPGALPQQQQSAGGGGARPFGDGDKSGSGVAPSLLRRPPGTRRSVSPPAPGSGRMPGVSPVRGPGAAADDSDPSINMTNSQQESQNRVAATKNAILAQLQASGGGGGALFPRGPPRHQSSGSGGGAPQGLAQPITVGRNSADSGRKPAPPPGKAKRQSSVDSPVAGGASAAAATTVAPGGALQQPISPQTPSGLAGDGGERPLSMVDEVDVDTFSLDLIDAENILGTLSCSMERANADSSRGFEPEFTSGVLFATSFRVMFFKYGDPVRQSESTARQSGDGKQEDDENVHTYLLWQVPVHFLRRVDASTGGGSGFRAKSSRTTVLSLDSKDGQLRRFQVSNVNSQILVAFANVLSSVAFSGPTFPFDHYAAACERLGRAPRRRLNYNIMGEYERCGIASYTPLRMIQNQRLCGTYPSTIVVPVGVTDDELERVAQYRSHQRIPVVTWLHPQSKATISRSAQPLVGLQSNQSADDVKLICMLRNITRKRLFYIIDARKKLASRANRAIGKGTEVVKFYPGTEIVHTNIENIHAVRESEANLRALCRPDAQMDQHWHSKFGQSQWTYHLQTVLAAAVFVVDIVHVKGYSCLVHCSDGWDRTPQITSLAQIMLDPYYRTLEGFLTLIQKEWCDFGHQFQTRCAHANGNPNDDNRSPIFVMFLDCVWQMVRQHPRQFQINERLLVFLADHTYSCRFGTFLFDSRKQREEADVDGRTLSVWSYVLARSPQFSNAKFQPPTQRAPEPVVPSVNSRNIRLWTNYYQRFDTTLLPEPITYTEYV